MENKFVKKPTPKGDKSTRIVFIGLLLALLFIIAGAAIFFAVNSSSKATKGSAASSKSSTTVYSGSNAEDPLFKITLKTFGDNKEFLLVTPNPGHDRNMFNIVGVAGQYLVTQEYKGVNLVRKMPRVRHFISITTLISICMTRKNQIKNLNKLTS